MAKLKNSIFNNQFGNGKEQIFTTDKGESYTIKNSPLHNQFGDGYEKKISKGNNHDVPFEYIPMFLLIVLPFILGAFGLTFLIASLFS